MASLSKEVYDKINEEWSKFANRLTENKDVAYIAGRLERGTLLVSVYKRVSDKDGRRAINIISGGSETILELNDNDLAAIGNAVTMALDGLHLSIPRKGYYRKSSVDYYIRPDWKFWYSEENQNA